MRSVVLLRTRRPALAAMIAAALATACSDPAHVRVTPLGGKCAQPAGANLVKVTAYTASGDHSHAISIGQTLAISDFPADTEQIAIEVAIGGGTTGAAGKSAPLVFDALPDGAAIPIQMAPPDGFCELPPMNEARRQPLVAPAGNGALVVGGTAMGRPLSTAEYYDAASEAFSRVAVPQALVDDQGFVGAALAPLPDGRVALVGGPARAFVVFDPAARAFVTDPTLIEARAFHAAIATGPGEVLVAGGCSAVTSRACGGMPRPQALRYRLDRLSTPEPAALVASPPAGAQLFDLGPQVDGRRGYLLAGGTGGAGRAARFALDDHDAVELEGGRVQAAALDGGAVLTAFGDDLAPAGDGTAAVFSPGVAAARPVATAPALQDMRLIALEDGRVAAFGGNDPLGRVQIYDPMRDAWTAVTPGSSGSTDQTGALGAPSLARLPDGTVLVVGGTESARAWLFRPALTGPASGSVTAIPVSDVSTGVLTATDPAAVTRVSGQLPAWLLTTPAGAAMAPALVGGPRIAVGSVRAIVQVVRGGVALIAQQTGPGQAIRAELQPGSPTRLVQIVAGAEREVCHAPGSGAIFDPATPVTVQLAISDHDARLSIDSSEVLACDLVATERGAWGIASLGDAAQLAVDLVTVAR